VDKRISENILSKSITPAKGGYYFRFDFHESNNSDDMLQELREDLRETGLELVDFCVEHDCISGDIKFKPMESEARTVALKVDTTYSIYGWDSLGLKELSKVLAFIAAKEVNTPDLKLIITMGKWLNKSEKF